MKIKSKVIFVIDWIRRPFRVKHMYKIRFGKGVKISKSANLTIGDHTFIGKDTVFGGGRVDIGRYCSIGPECIIPLNNHPVNFISTSPLFYSQNRGANVDLRNDLNLCDTRIGHDVWIGSRVMIKAGVKIGDGAIIGAGSIVTHNVDDYAIVAGSPAKLLRYRFSKESARKLKESKWYEKNIDELNVDHFLTPYE